MSCETVELNIGCLLAYPGCLSNKKFNYHWTFGVSLLILVTMKAWYVSYVIWSINRSPKWGIPALLRFCCWLFTACLSPTSHHIANTIFEICWIAGHELRTSYTRARRSLKFIELFIAEVYWTGEMYLHCFACPALAQWGTYLPPNMNMFLKHTGRPGCKYYQAPSVAKASNAYFLDHQSVAAVPSSYNRGGV